MPELPEVESFRQILLPLVSLPKDLKLPKVISSKKAATSHSTVIECPSPVPPKSFPPNHVIESINQGGYILSDVVRKGKVLCIILDKNQSVKSGNGSASRKKRKSRTKSESSELVNDGIGLDTITGNESRIFLSLHMGMTGRISSPGHVPSLESLSDSDAYPPPHTHMIIRAPNGNEACFSDPRRFGTVLVHGCSGEGRSNSGEDHATDDSIIPTFQDLASDALHASKEYFIKVDDKTNDKGSDSEMQPTIVDRFMNRRKGIKAVLLDQRAVVSGVGNWVADEILYRSGIHPDQTFLLMSEAKNLVVEMHYVLTIAVKCLIDGDDFPEDWLFHRRWRSGGGSETVKDFNGKEITFLQSGGRSTAIVQALQKKRTIKIDNKKKAKVNGGSVPSSKGAKGTTKSGNCLDDSSTSKIVSKKRSGGEGAKSSSHKRKRSDEQRSMTNLVSQRRSNRKKPGT